MSAAAIALSAQHGGIWTEHPTWPLREWMDDVAQCATRLSYWDWVIAQIEMTGVA